MSKDTNNKEKKVRWEFAKSNQSVYIAKISEESARKNVKVLGQKIRIKVLDCRSGDPIKKVPVEAVKINNEWAAAYYANKEIADWDIGTHFPLYPKDGDWWMCDKKINVSKKTKKNLRGLGKASQIALKALGFNPGDPTEDYGLQGKTAFLKYKLKYGKLVLTDLHVDHTLYDIEGYMRAAQQSIEWEPWLEQWDLQEKIETRKILDKDDFDDKDDSYLKKEYMDVDRERIRATPTEEEMNKIIDIYNALCYRAAKFHLAALGYYPKGENPLKDCAMDEEDEWKWTSKWITVFKNWQKIERNRRPSKTKERIVWKSDGEKLKKSKKLLLTDNKGVLHIPVTKAEMENEKGCKIELKFNDFVIVPEATQKQIDNNKERLIHRQKEKGDKPKSNATGFSVEWVGDQTEQVNDWDQGWGWRIGPEPAPDKKTREKFAEFKTSATFNIDGNPDKKKLKELHKDTHTFSMFYDKEKDHPEFVVFALIWCQPVWDEFDDAQTKSDIAAFTEKTYVPADKPGSVHMHIPTLYSFCGGTKLYGGKGYGKYEYKMGDGNFFWRSDGHKGIDLYALENDKVFAVHAGYVWNSNANWSNPGFVNPSISGKYVNLDWKDADHPISFIQYLHLKEFKTDGTKNDKKTVKAGQIVGLAGRTGNLGYNKIDNQAPYWQAADTAWPGHCHLWVDKKAGRTPRLPETPDEHNRICIPTNDTPLMFPCACEITLEACNPKDCNFDKWFAASCWAVAELMCPNLLQDKDVALGDLEGSATDTTKRKRIQAQLRYLFENPPDGVSDLRHPGVLDGDFDNTSVLSTVAGANLREGPSQADEVKGQLNKWQACKYLATQGSYYKVKVGTSTLYIHNSVSEKVTTRAAIKAFREAFSGETQEDVPEGADGEKITQKALELLNIKARVDKPS